jgi:hypothetical protein
MLHKGPEIWSGNLEQPMQWKTGVRFGLNLFRSGQVPVAALVNVVINLQVGKRMMGISRVAEQLLASQELSSMELAI